MYQSVLFVTFGNQIRFLYLEILHEVWSKGVRDLTHVFSLFSACDDFSFFAALMFFIFHYFYVFCVMACLKTNDFNFTAFVIH